ncbi:UNVERIFIED_CONTAM: hypothetical protein Slati_0482500 [Sesamum latifolium]|uniref:Uncharacterized protein n=1 Tax=Sesamum latifolium TaxID=2727402 RepID=A0AAW2XXG7_9LAMI
MILLRVGRAIIFSNDRGTAIFQKLVRNHNFREGDALSFIIKGSSYLILNNLKVFLKALETGKPLGRNLLRSQRGSLLPSCPLGAHGQGCLLQLPL